MSDVRDDERKEGEGRLPEPLEAAPDEGVRAPDEADAQAGNPDDRSNSARLAEQRLAEPPPDEMARLEQAELHAAGVHAVADGHDGVRVPDADAQLSELTSEPRMWDGGEPSDTYRHDDLASPDDVNVEQLHMPATDHLAPPEDITSDPRYMEPLGPNDPEAARWNTELQHIRDHAADKGEGSDLLTPDGADASPDSSTPFDSVRDDAPSVDPERAAVGEQEKLDNLQRSLGEIPELRHEEWRNLDDLERQRATEHGVEVIAREYGIETPRVELIEAAPRLQGYYTRDNHTLYLNTHATASDGTSAWDNPAAVMETSAHETRHAYQHAAVDDYRRGRDSDPLAVEWSENFDDYIPPERDFPGYYDQPVERDARTFGADVRRRMYG